MNHMICIPVNIPPELCAIDDERKAIYHSQDSVCVWVFATTKERDSFMIETKGMDKDDRQAHYDAVYAPKA